MRIRVTGASALHLRQDLHSGPMNTTTFARDGLHRWRGMDAGHRGRAVDIEVGMQIGIQVLFAGLVIFTLVMALVLSPPRLGRILMWAVLLIVVYTALMGTHVMGRSRREMWRPFLVVAMVVVSILLAIDFPYAAYLTIPLSFVYLDHLPPLQACIAVVVGAVAIVLGVGLTGGWSVGGIVGPVAGAAVAVVVGLSLKAMQLRRPSWNVSMWTCWRYKRGWLTPSVRPVHWRREPD
ncbi:hypothetical protein JCM18920_769 [Cutibacterium acnes JCM 18920]|nr:hypothetical protein JCM18920_769 [Cutibacterium acnes JCM 18920]